MRNFKLYRDNKSQPWFLHALTLIFVTLKLTNVITWSWFWVLSPLLIPLLIFLFFVLVQLLIDWFDK